MEKHEFVSDSSIIRHFIESQAGSLGKALGEYIMNSADAKATKVDLTLNRHGFMVVDDGEGMPTRELILEVFKHFGFDHSNHQRQWGRFGLGRAQSWNWASTKWYTHGWLLDVDVRARGLEWHLHKDQPHQPGVRIEGTFYDPLSAVDQMETIRDLGRISRYMDIDVFVNGEQVNRPPSKQDWTEETDSYYLTVNDSSYLHVYNMGVFVCDIYAGTAGSGGTLVTKAGSPLTLNVARNDIMRNTCSVWAAINKRLRELARERADKPAPNRRTTDADRDFMAQRTADPDDAGAFTGAMFTLSTGRHITLQRINDMCRAGAVLTTAEQGDPIAEKLYRDKRVVPLAEKTLERFGMSDVGGFRDELIRRLGESLHMRWLAQRGWAHPYSGIAAADVHERLATCPGFAMHQSRVVPDHELSKADKEGLWAIRAMVPSIAAHVRKVQSTPVVDREVVMGQSNQAEAYTDGSTYIAVVDTFMRECLRSGLPGFHRIAGVMVHELLHNSDDSGSHTHDLEFMESFHEVMLSEGEGIAKAAAEGFKRWATAQAKLSRARAKELDMLNNAAAAAA